MVRQPVYFSGCALFLHMFFSIRKGPGASGMSGSNNGRCYEYTKSKYLKAGYFFCEGLCQGSFSFSGHVLSFFVQCDGQPLSCRRVVCEWLLCRAEECGREAAAASGGPAALAAAKAEDYNDVRAPPARAVSSCRYPTALVASTALRAAMCCRMIDIWITLETPNILLAFACTDPAFLSRPHLLARSRTRVQPPHKKSYGLLNIKEWNDDHVPAPIER